MSTTIDIPIDVRNQMASIFEVLAQIDDNDRYCQKILLFLCVTYPKKHGFNELRRQLNSKKQGPTFTRKTLSNHLNHLLELEIITFEIIEESNLTIKPKKYYLNSNFVKIVKDIFVYDYDLLQSDIYQDFLEVGVKALTIALIDIMISDVIQLLSDKLIYSEKIADYRRQRVSIRSEIITNAYYRRVIELKEKDDALSLIKNIVKTWRDLRDEKWGSLINNLIEKEVVEKK
jgi:DNA-binding HxlR family transcriptional regulator